MGQTAASKSAPIPFLDLKTPHRELSAEILAAWKTILENAAFIGGPEVEAFEKEFAAAVGSGHAVGVGSGTDALRLALLALGLAPGDEVITPAHTFIATTEAITQAGGKPVLVDVDAETGTIDPARIESAVTSRTRALVPVHLYGQTADMDPILEIAGRRGIEVVEDACQAHGAEYRGRKAGTMGRVAAFSFYPGKNLGACGEAGTVTMGDAALAQQVRMLRDHGQARKYEHDREGYNARLDALQAAALRIKLRRLEAWNESRRRSARRYIRNLAGSSVRVPAEVADRKHVWHLFVIRHPERDRVRNALSEANIASGLHYPVPLHLQRAYEGLGFARGDFPESERWAFEGLSLPMFPGMTHDQVDRVSETVLRAVS